LSRNLIGRIILNNITTALNQLFYFCEVTLIIFGVFLSRYSSNGFSFKNFFGTKCNEFFREKIIDTISDIKIMNSLIKIFFLMKYDF